MSTFNQLALIAAVLCLNVINTTGRPTGHNRRLAQSLGLSRPDFKIYMKNIRRLKKIMAAFNNLTIQEKPISPLFDDMIFPPDIVERLIERYKILMEERNNKRPKRKIAEFKRFNPDLKWEFSEQNPIKYKIDKELNSFSKDIDKAFQHWEEHTCFRFKKLVTKKGNSTTIEGHHIVVDNGVNDTEMTCSAFVGRNINHNSQPIYMNYNCMPYIGVAIHEIGHALGLYHEHMKHNAKEFITIRRKYMHYRYIHDFIPLEGIVSLGVPYDLNSVMHYSGDKRSWIEGKNVIITNDPLYQMNVGQRVELSFLDKKIVNLEYCKDSCPKILPCNRSGYTDPNNCNQCVCPDGFGGRLCDTVGDTHHKACQKPQIIKVTDTEQCITMKPYKPFTECHWHLQAGSGEKIEVYFKNKFAVYYEKFVCFHWVEIKYKGDYSMPGPRFCGENTTKTKLLSDADLVVVSFKSNYKDGTTKLTKQGFTLCFQLGSCPEKAVLSCDTLDEWEITTQPSLTQELFQQAIDGCQGKVETREKIRFIIKLIGGRPFTIDKLCLKRPGAKAVVLIMELPSKFSSLVMLQNMPCLDAKTFTRIGGPIKKLTIEVQTRKDISVSDIMLEVCKQ